MPTEVNIEAILLRAVEGDRDAAAHLLLQHYDRLEARIAAALPASSTPLVQVEDVIQETFVHAIRSMPHCRAISVESFAAWLDAIANHRLLDAVRRLKTQKRGGTHAYRERMALDEMPGGHRIEWTPGHTAARIEAVAGITSAIECLPTDQRAAIQLHYLQGRTLDQTAEAIHRSPAAVRGLLHRAKDRLRELLQSSSRWFDKK